MALYHMWMQTDLSGWRSCHVTCLNVIWAMIRRQLKSHIISHIFYIGDIPMILRQKFRHKFDNLFRTEPNQNTKTAEQNLWLHPEIAMK